jgi:hypothetical protein
MRPDRLRLPALLALALGQLFASAAAAEPVPAYRLVLEYNSGGIRLRDAVPVVKTLPPTDTALGGGASAFAPARQGAWFEVRSKQGTVLYRRLMRDPSVVAFEGPATPNGTDIARIETVVDKGVFTILVPQDDKAAEVLLFAPTHAAPSARTRGVPTAEPPGAAQEIGRIPFPPPTPR